MTRAETLGIVIVVFLGAATIVMAVGTARNPPPQLDFDRHEMRIGTDVTPFARITDAILPTVPNGRVQDETLLVGAPHHRQAAFVLRAKRLPVLNATDREIVADMIALSDIRVPVAKPDPYDPQGRFAWMDHPFNRTKDQAIALVLESPTEGKG